MKLPLKILVSIWAALPCLPAATMAGETVGVREVAAPSRERGIDLAVTVWYRAEPGGTPVTLGQSVFFAGTTALRDAPVAPGRYPLVVLSHGAGLAGNAQALSWIATPLASQGFVVAAPTHPGNSGPDRSAAETIKLWLRPADIAATLDAMNTQPPFTAHLDRGSVGILGLSMGGGTALAAAGARIDPHRLARYCDTDALNPSFCEWVRLSGLDLHEMDLAPAGRDNEDRRIRFAMAIDPTPVDVFDVPSFKRIAIPVDLVNLGQAAHIPLTAQAAEIAKAIPQARYSTIADASHYSMFAECRPGAAALAEEEKLGEPICADGGGRSRHDIHTQLIAMVVDAFTRALKPQR